MTVKLLTEHHLKFRSLKGVCTGLSESTLIKMPQSWKYRGLFNSMSKHKHMNPTPNSMSRSHKYINQSCHDTFESISHIRVYIPSRIISTCFQPYQSTNRTFFLI